ncbi:flagellar basal body P-ring formation chaperone FlgA [Thermosipho globiformans]|uniref:flagellar basal body P-ring formation chaperone FlgA n=1 Tax=Thermosipho globiformans TaxID=380685 RepID=UPI000F8CD3CA|nr:flagellar basal body P-ring formation chaperone FlgA [Thermosipho globiformans]
MRKGILFVLLLPILSLSMYIQFLDVATVTRNEVTVFDVAATYTQIDATSLQNIVLAYLPENSSTDINIKYILQRLSRVATQIEATPTVGVVKVVFPNLLTSESSMSTLTVEQALKIATESALSMLPVNSTVEVTSTYGKIVEHDNFDYDVIQSVGGSFLVRFALKKDGRTVGYFNVNLIGKCIRKIPVAARNINYGDQVNLDDVTFADVNIFSLRGTPLDVSKLPMISRKYFKVGEPLFEEYFERVPDVVVGQVIVGYVELPGVIVKTMLRALESGNVGDVIKARNIESGKIVYGLIVEGPMLKVVEVSK